MLLPSAALALPMDYELDEGQVSVGLSQGGFTFGFDIELESGTFTFDEETGTVSNLSVVAAGYELSLGSTTGWVVLEQSPDSASLIVQKIQNFGSGQHALAWGQSLSVSILLQGHLVDRVSALTTPSAAVPEPGAAMLFGAGLIVAGASCRRSRASASASK